jgi:RNA polymerase sigma-70 factor (ECF subfamily)
MTHDGTNLEALLQDYRPRLRRMVELRMDPHLHARLDASDVVQEAFVDVTRRLPEYEESRDLPFFLWVRFLTGQKLLEMHRRHLGAKKRDARRERALGRPAFPEASSIAISQVLCRQGPTPSQEVAREEERRKLQEALEAMDDVDREVLVLRHFEQLNNAESARVLDLSESATSRRYARAIRHLREIMTRLYGTWSGGDGGPA